MTFSSDVTTVARQDPIVVLRQELAEHRRNGLDFEEAWHLARDRALRAARGYDKEATVGALRDTRQVWEAAYERSEEDAHVCMSVLAEACDGFVQTAEIGV